MKKISFIILFMIGILAHGLHAQVTIGSTIAPNGGALLDLKQEGTTTKGLGIPRVTLNKLDPADGSALAKSIGNNTAGASYDKNEHIGLIVYNVKKDQCATPEPIVKGLYVWDGGQWQYLGKKEEPLPSPDVKSFTDPRDQEVYLTRQFGITAGIWMLENLRYDPIEHPDPDFTDFTHTAADSPTAKHFAYAEEDGFYVPDDHPSSEWPNRKKNGLFYNWPAATNGKNPSTDDQAFNESDEGPHPSIQGICPPTWHIPSDKEWKELEAELVAFPGKYSTLAVSEGVGSTMKTPCPVPGSSEGIDPTASSLSAMQGGFAVLLAGYATNNSVGGYGEFGDFWTASSYNSGKAWNRYVLFDVLDLDRNDGNRLGFCSVRCKKDD